jgi:hypothetical protein
MDDDMLLIKAREVGFCQRVGKLSPRHFIEMLLCKCFSAAQGSLVDHAIDLKLNRGIEIKKQSIQNKFTDKAVAFVKSLVSTQMSKKFDLPSTYLPMFSAILIQDSTRFGLPESLSESYKGYGGRGSKAGGKVQFAYDLKTHQMYYTSFNAVTTNDHTESKNNEWIKKGALILRDLGYYSIEGLQEIADKQAFYISKVKPKTALFTLKGQRFDLIKCVEQMKRNRITHLEETLRIGNGKKIEGRVVISLVPDEIKEHRARAVAYKAKTRKHTVQKQYKIWTSVNVYVTNLNKEKLSLEQIINLYRLRWQVELVFKTWKSHYKIDHYKAMRKERVECYLYVTLLLIMLHWRIFSWINQKLYYKNLTLSVHKFSKIMIHLSELFNTIILRWKYKIDIFLDNVLSLAELYMQKEKKKNKIGFSDITQLSSYVYC